MKNSDQPAFAISGVYAPEKLGHGSADGLIVQPQPGLTKREYFAVRIAQALTASGEKSASIIAKLSIQIADELLYQLTAK